MVDVVGVPHRREEGVGEAEGEEVLHRLLPEVVIDPVDLLLAPVGEQPAIQLPRRGEIAAEGLLDDDPPRPREPGEARAVELPIDQREQVGGDRQVDERVAGGTAFGGHPLDERFQAFERPGVVEVARHVMEARLEPPPGILVELRPRREGPDRGALHRAEGVRVELAPPHPHHREGVGEEPVGGEVQKRRQEEPFRQVAGGPEDHEHPRRRGRRAHRRTDRVARRGFAHAAPVHST